MALRGPERRDNDGAVAVPNATAVVMAMEKMVMLDSSPLNSKSHINNLSEELLVEILRRLPLKPANRSKCVSKRWFNLISTTYFARRYRSFIVNHTPPSALFYQHTRLGTEVLPPDRTGVHIASTGESIFESPGFSLNFLPSSPPPPPPLDQQLQLQHPAPFYCLASSNGLVLCCATLSFQRLYYVCNPLTMQWVALPLPPTCPQKVRIGFICKSSYSDDEETNFSSTTHFTVVRILQFDDPPPPGRLSRFSSTLKLEMFSSETGKWTQSVTKSKSRSMRFVWCELHAPASAVVCNGILHWCDLWAASADSIFAHDPSSNTDYRIIKLPKDKNWGTHIHCFGECQEHLMFAKFCGGIFKVWQLKDYNRGEWSLLHAVHLTIDPQIFKYATCSDPDMYILAFHPTDRDVLFLGFPGYIILCNLRSTTLKAVCCLVHPNAYLLSSMVFPFVLPWWPTPVPPLPSPE